MSQSSEGRRVCEDHGCKARSLADHRADHVVAVDAVTLNDSARYQADTVNVGPGQRYDVVWTARKPGKWLVHCHIPHHTANNNVAHKGGGGLMIVLDMK